MTFQPGSTITVREVWDGQEWLSFPEVVVSDSDSDSDSDGVLATLIVPGAPLSFPEHPGGPHPWSRQTHWGSTTVLKLRRPGEWYSVWKFFDGDGVFLRWYVNFERPYVRRRDGIDIDDLELDLVVHPDGRREWKDVEALDARLAERRFSVDDLRRVLATAPVVVDLLERDDRWWSGWDDWVPVERQTRAHD